MNSHCQWLKLRWSQTCKSSEGRKSMVSRHQIQDLFTKRKYLETNMLKKHQPLRHKLVEFKSNILEPGRSMYMVIVIKVTLVLSKHGRLNEVPSTNLNSPASLWLITQEFGNTNTKFQLSRTHGNWQPWVFFKYYYILLLSLMGCGFGRISLQPKGMLHSERI